MHAFLIRPDLPPSGKLTGKAGILFKTEYQNYQTQQSWLAL